jgi:hypothetical protein
LERFVEKPDWPPPDEETSRHFLPGSSSLAVLLIVFLALSLLTLFSIMRGGTGHAASDAGGTRAWGPADFPEIDFDRELLPEVRDAGVSGQAESFRVRLPLAYEDYYPCSDCHAEMEVDLERRELEEMHDDIQLHHGPEDRWCFDCHNPDDRDSLRLANGSLISFEESYRLCGQCHGTIYRDWREGIHGRREGYWNGAKSYQLCAHCHNPHAPRFAAIEPLPPPVRPQFLRAAAGEIVDGDTDQEGRHD